MSFDLNDLNLAIEKIARAIHEAAWGPGAWLLVQPDGAEYEEAMAQARAAIAALPEGPRERHALVQWIMEGESDG